MVYLGKIIHKAILWDLCSSCPWPGPSEVHGRHSTFPPRIQLKSNPAKNVSYDQALNTTPPVEYSLLRDIHLAQTTGRTDSVRLLRTNVTALTATITNIIVHGDHY